MNDVLSAMSVMIIDSSHCKACVLYHVVEIFILFNTFRLTVIDVTYNSI